MASVKLKLEVTDYKYPSPAYEFGFFVIADDGTKSWDSVGIDLDAEPSSVAWALREMADKIDEIGGKE